MIGGMCKVKVIVYDCLYFFTINLIPNMTTFFLPFNPTNGLRVCVRREYVHAWCSMLHSLWPCSEKWNFDLLTPPPPPKVWSYYVKRFRRRYIYKKIHNLTFDLDLGVKVIQNVAQYPLHHVTYSATKFEVTTSNGSGGDTFTRKYITWPLTLMLGSRSHKMLPSTIYTMRPKQLQSLQLLHLTV